MPLLPLANIILRDVPKDPPICNNQDIPRDEMDIFFRADSNFLPPGKTWADLTEKEKKEVNARYRFDPLRPGMYQAITACGRMGDNI